MKRWAHLILIIVLLVVLVACNLPTGESQTPEPGIVSTKVAATIQALTQIAGAKESLVPLATPTLSKLQETSTPQATPTLATPTLTLSPTLTLPPTLTPSPTLTFTPSATITPLPGSISGHISGYPYGNVPGLAIVAFDQKSPYLMYWYWITGAGESYYSMDKYIPPSTYQVVAYDSSGHAGGCTTLVVVTSDTTSTCDITNWGGSYPGKPAGVPNP